jgi:hypothetical protein
MKQTNLSRRQQYIFNLSAFETLRNPKRKCHFVLQANDIESTTPNQPPWRQSFVNFNTQN